MSRWRSMSSRNTMTCFFMAQFLLPAVLRGDDAGLLVGGQGADAGVVGNPPLTQIRLRPSHADSLNQQPLLRREPCRRGRHIRLLRALAPAAAVVRVAARHP